MERKIVLVRSANSGVWIGVLVERTATDVTLNEARKIWRWRGANTTSELALRGPDKGYSRVADPIDGAIVSGYCEILPSNDAALKRAAECGWGGE